jgi:ABC-type branched-subunit amino acid transport system substrate-binding protein
MKKVLGTLIIIGLLAVGCVKRAPAPGVTDTEVLIGNVQDLSGPLKELGAIIPSGSNMYFQYINDQGGVHGRSIKMLIEDHQYNPQKAVAATKKLVEKDQVFCLFQILGTSPCEAIRPILSETGTPLIAPATNSGTMSDLSREAGDLIFHTDTGYDRQGEILVDYILNQNSDAKIGIVYQDDDYGENVLEGIARAEAEHEITVQKESYQRGAIDFKGQTMNLLKGGCTDVIIAGIVREPVTVMKTAEAMNYKPNFFGTGPTVDARVGKLAGSAGEGFTATYWANMWNSDAPGPILYRELCEKYDIPEPYIGLYHYYGFATAQLLVEGLERAGRNPTRKSLVRGLETFKNWDVGSFPPITYNRNDHAGVDKVQLVQMQNGEQVVITDWLE